MKILNKVSKKKQYQIEFVGGGGIKNGWKKYYIALDLMRFTQRCVIVIQIIRLRLRLRLRLYELVLGNHNRLQLPLFFVRLNRLWYSLWRWIRFLRWCFLFLISSCSLLSEMSREAFSLDSNWLSRFGM